MLSIINKLAFTLILHFFQLIFKENIKYINGEVRNVFKTLVLVYSNVTEVLSNTIIGIRK